jgi:phosphatidate cytidylyltransferase
LLRTRVLTGAGIAVVVLLTVLKLDTPLASLVFGAIWLLGAGEWARLAGLGKLGRVVYGASFGLFFAGILGLGSIGSAGWLLLWLAVASWAVAFAWVLRFPPPLPRWIVLGAGLIVLSAAWTAFFLLHGAGPDGPSLVLTGLLIVWSADVGAFFAGRTLGRTPLAPRVSPKKTWEGVVGGVLLAAIVGSLAAAYLNLSYALLMPLAAGAALVSVVGDLSISMLKRWAGKKDSGMLLPGHGGILDRFDGVTAALPFYALGLQFAHVLD